MPRSSDRRRKAQATASERIYRRLLRLYPPSFRNEFGQDMAELFRDALRAESRGRGLAGVVSLWRRTAWGLLTTALAARFEGEPCPKKSSQFSNPRHRSDTMLNAWLQDLQFATRAIVRRPALAATVVLTLALGIGANGALFSVVDALLLRPLPFDEPDRLVNLWETDAHRNPQGDHRSSIGWHNFRDWQDQAELFEGIAAYTPAELTLRSGEEPLRLEGRRVSANFFSLLGSEMLIGRGFESGEDVFGAEPVVILDEDLWRRQFGGDAGILGRTVELESSRGGGGLYTVVGVMPSSFAFPDAETTLWLPLQMDPERVDRGDHMLDGFGRLRDGVTRAQAQAEMDAITAHLAAEYPETNQGDGALVLPLREVLVDRATRRSVMLLWATASFVLLIACANLASLLLVSATRRSREIAVRAALGAGRWRLSRQLLAESLLLVAAGGVAGLLAARFGLDVLLTYLTGRFGDLLPGLTGVGVDLRVAGFTLTVTVVCGLLFGLIPIFHAAPGGFSRSLRGGSGRLGGSRRSHRFMQSFVVTEVALALVLLVGAGLMTQTLIGLESADLGFEPRRLTTLRVALSTTDYSEDAEAVAYFDNVLERLEALPGVESVAAASTPPLADWSLGTDAWTLDDRPAWAVGEEPAARWITVTPGYFRTLEIPVERGRDFASLDHQDAAPVMIINDLMAEEYWPGQDAVGQRITLWGTSREIVGIAGTVDYEGPREAGRRQIYLPESQITWNTLHLTVRHRTDAASNVSDLRAAIRSVDASVPIFGVRTMESAIGDHVAVPRLVAQLLAGFSAVALLLAALGIYGLTSFAVVERTREMGLRLALGAVYQDLLRLVVGKALVLAAIGLAVGLALAAAAARLLESLVFGVETLDLKTFAAAFALLFLAALVASYLPAHRAARSDPMVALRDE